MHGLFGRLRWLPLLLGAAGCASGGDRPAVPDSCPSGEIRDAGECVPEACGTGKWGNIPVDSDTIYVDANADPPGIGTATSPYTAVQKGVDMAAARGGALVALAAGTYVETIEMGNEHARVALSGRCKELVTIDGHADAHRRGSRGRADVVATLSERCTNRDRCFPSIHLALPA